MENKPFYSKEEIDKLKGDSIQRSDLKYELETISWYEPDVKLKLTNPLLFNRTQRHIIIHHPSRFNEWSIRLFMYKVVRFLTIKNKEL